MDVIACSIIVDDATFYGRPCVCAVCRRVLCRNFHHTTPHQTAPQLARLWSRTHARQRGVRARSFSRPGSFRDRVRYTLSQAADLALQPARQTDDRRTQHC